jgi:hypothetical protein
MNKFILRRQIIVALVSLFAVTLMSEDGQARRRKRRSKGKVIVNQILKLDGTITNNGRPAVEFSEVKQGDLLETGASSYAVVRVPGLGLFRMGPQTQFKMTSFMDRNNTKLEITKGEVLALYRRMGDHELKSANGVVSPRLATLHLTSRPGEKSDLLCLCKGRLALPQIASTASQAPPASASQTPPAASPAAAVGVTAVTPNASAKSEPQLSVEAGGKIPPEVPMQIESSGEHKRFELAPKNIEPREVSPPKAHSESLIQDLESLYALP